MDDDELMRFWSKVKVGTAEECWPWPEPSRDAGGYGIWYSRGGKFRAHRWLLGQLRGEPLIDKPRGIEDGCHRCDNPPCVNPAHLYVGTRGENMADAVERSRLWQLQRTQCPAGHPYDEENTIVRAKGWRKCRTCERDADRRRRPERYTDLRA